MGLTKQKQKQNKENRGKNQRAWGHIHGICSIYTRKNKLKRDSGACGTINKDQIFLSLKSRKTGEKSKRKTWGWKNTQINGWKLLKFTERHKPTDKRLLKQIHAKIPHN